MESQDEVKLTYTGPGFFKLAASLPSSATSPGRTKFLEAPAQEYHFCFSIFSPLPAHPSPLPSSPQGCLQLSEDEIPPQIHLYDKNFNRSPIYFVDTKDLMAF